MATPLPYLLVDGYNIIGAWLHLKEEAEKFGLEVARTTLLEELINFASQADFQTCVVFDAYTQRTPGTEEILTENLSAYFTDFGQTADTYIEKVCATIRHQPRRVLVATSDQAQRHTVVGYGAEWLSAAQLLNELEASNRQRRLKQRARKKARNNLFFNSDSKVQQQLERWRHGIS
ncbi:MAG: NYN domain-containing protein [Cyanobacteria bacterium P01_H01_bin.15]